MFWRGASQSGDQMKVSEWVWVKNHPPDNCKSQKREFSPLQISTTTIDVILDKMWKRYSRPWLLCPPKPNPQILFLNSTGMKGNAIRVQWTWPMKVIWILSIYTTKRDKPITLAWYLSNSKQNDDNKTQAASASAFKHRKKPSGTKISIRDTLGVQEMLLKRVINLIEPWSIVLLFMDCSSWGILKEILFQQLRMLSLTNNQFRQPFAQ